MGELEKFVYFDAKLNTSKKKKTIEVRKINTGMLQYFPVQLPHFLCSLQLEKLEYCASKY